MTMRASDPITATARDNSLELVQTAYEYLETFDTLYMDDIIPEYLRELFLQCQQFGISFVLAFAQFCHETDNGRSPIFRDFRNPAGIAIEDDHNHSLVYMNGRDAARAHVTHLVAYAYGATVELPQAFIDLDPNYRKVLGLSWAGTIRTIAQLTGKWATDLSYHNKIIARGNEIFPNLPDAGASPNPQEVPAMAGAVVLLTAGHRNTSGGDPEEAARTPKIARAYKAAFEASGHQVAYLQNNRENWYNGTLDGVARWVVAEAAKHPGDNLIMIDCHIEGGGPSGVFSIVPNGAGLSTVAPGNHSVDSWEANPKDVQTAHAISAGIAARTGLPQRMCRERGVMDEHETGVGGDGFRLGMFAWTLPIQPRTVRLVVEHGDLQRDRGAIDAIDFMAKAAAGALQGVEQIFGNPKDPIGPRPTPPPVTKIAYPDGFDYGTTARAWGRKVKGVYFSEDGAASKVWIGKKDYSPLMDHWVFPDGREYFYFGSGLVVGRLAKAESFRVLI